MIEFSNAIRAAGIDPPADIVADGTLHRFHIEGDKPRTENGWYVLYDKPPAGSFGRWNKGEGGTSQAWSGREYQSYTPEEKARHKANMEALKLQRQEDQTRTYIAARSRAKSIYDSAGPALEDHPYLAKKKIEPNGARLSNGALVIPLRDTAGTLHGLQFIDAEGNKKFLSGTAKAGNYFAIGKPNGALFITEGFATGASIHESTGYAVAVAFDAGNLEPVARALHDKYSDFEIIVCGDNDQSGTGQKAATAAALAVNGMVIWPPTTGEDFNDLTTREGKGSCCAVIDSATTPLSTPSLKEESPSESMQGGDFWPEPLPIESEIESVPYPMDALPDSIRLAIDEVLGFVKAPAPLVISAALSALSMAIQAHADIERAVKLSGPSSLFLLTIAESGERKSTCDGFFTSAIRDYEAEKAAAAKPDIERYESELTAWEAKHSGVKDSIRLLSKNGETTAEKEADLLKLQYDKPQRPRVPRIIYGDATPEALKHSLAKQWPSGAVVASEAGVVFGSHGMGKDSAMRNLATLNQLWDGTDMPTERRASESYTVKGARLTMSLMVQEATLRAFFKQDNGLARGTGFLARFLISWPESTQGFRPFTDAPENWPHLATFNRRIAEILRQPAPIADDGSLTPVMLPLSPEAKEAWIAFHDAIESELAAGGELFDVRDVASKTADNAARLACLFQVFNDGAGAIALDAIESASMITAWHLNEARRFFGGLALPQELADAARLDSWLINYCQREKVGAVSVSKILQNGPSGLRAKATMDKAVEELEGLDRVRQLKDGKRRSVQVNPKLLAGAP